MDSISTLSSLPKLPDMLLPTPSKVRPKTDNDSVYSNATSICEETTDQLRLGNDDSVDIESIYSQVVLSPTSPRLSRVPSTYMPMGTPHKNQISCCNSQSELTKEVSSSTCTGNKNKFFYKRPVKPNDSRTSMGKLPQHVETSRSLPLSDSVKSQEASGANTRVLIV